MQLQTREEYFIGRHLLTAKLWKAPGKGNIFRANPGSVHNLPKASRETRGEELNESVGTASSMLCFSASITNLVSEGQIMSCLSFVINIASG